MRISVKFAGCNLFIFNVKYFFTKFICEINEYDFTIYPSQILKRSKINKPYIIFNHSYKLLRKNIGFLIFSLT